MSARGLVYLHGFASSPRSSKARFFEQRAAEAGIPFVCPDLNQPDFTSLTVTRMLDAVDTAIPTLGVSAVALVGSSLGAFVAIHAAARRASRVEAAVDVDRLVMLAPALHLVPGLERDFGPVRMAEWEATGRLPIFHYGDNAERELGWSFMADARRYDSAAVALDVPVLIYQGRHDEVVHAADVERWAEGRSGVTLRLVDDGHQLLGHLDEMWTEVQRFVSS
jgi:pimeloyl-ACP methyl ester carboxylesterase